MKRILMTAGLFALLLGCSPAKRIERKDTKAVDRVTAKRPLLERVRPAVMDLWPYKPVAAGEVKPGKIDSIPYPVLTLDSAAIRRFMDSVQHSRDSICFDVALQSYLEGHDAAMSKLSSIKIPAPRVDTLPVIDNSLVDLKNSQLAQKDVIIGKAEARAEVYKKDRTNLLLLSGSLLVLLIGSNILWARAKGLKLLK